MSSLFISASLLWKGHILEKKRLRSKVGSSNFYGTWAWIYVFHFCFHSQDCFIHVLILGTKGQESRNNLYIGNDTNQHFHWLPKDFSLHQRNILTYFLRRKFYRKLPFTEVGDENKIFFNPYYQNLYISVSVKILRMHVYYDAYIYLMTIVSLSFCVKIRSVNLSLQ